MIVPPTGARFTWQSKTFMNTLMRRIGVSSNSSSAGGGAVAIACTTPSAGLTTSPAPSGTTRSGSRKKHTHHPVTISPIQPSGWATANRPRVATADMAMNGQPSRRMINGGNGRTLSGPCQMVWRVY